MNARMLTVAILVAAGLWSIIPAAAADLGWAGYYTGIDPHDGSIATISIAPTGDDTFQVIMKTDQLSICPDQSAAGFLVATAKIADGDFVREEGKFRCEGDDEFRTWPAGSYQRDTATGIVSQSAGHDGRTFYYHPTK